MGCGSLRSSLFSCLFFRCPATYDDILGRIPVGRGGEPADVAGAVVYLASPAAAMVKGTTLVIDGGWTAQ